MMEAGAHFGHQTRRWNPKMSKYIYCARNGVHIIDLVKTALCMNNAYKWTRNAAKSGKRFLFVGTKKQASDVVAQEAVRCGAADVNQRWLGGMLTNWTCLLYTSDACFFVPTNRKRLPLFAAFLVHLYALFIHNAVFTRSII